MAMTLKAAVALPVQAFEEWCRAHADEVVGLPAYVQVETHVLYGESDCPGAHFLADMVGQPVQVQQGLVGLPGGVPLHERRVVLGDTWVQDWYGEAQPTPAWLQKFMVRADLEDRPITGQRALTILAITQDDDPQEVF